MNSKKALWLTSLIILIFQFVLIFQVKIKDCEFGDSGLMYLQTRDFLHSNPKTIAFHYPGVSIDPSMDFLPYQAPFIAKIDNRAFIDFPPYFPILNSFFFQIFGDKGLYVWNYLGFAGTIFLLTLLLSSVSLTLWLQISILILYAIGSSLPIYNLYYHEYPLAIFLMTLSFYFYLKREDSNSILFNVLFGFFAGLSLFFRLELVFLFGSLGLAELLFGKDSGKDRFFFMIQSGLGFLIPFLLLLFLNQSLHFHPLGLRYLLTFEHPAHIALKRSDILFGLLFSDTRGLFTQTPYMIFPFLALPYFWNKENFSLEKKISFSLSICFLLICITAPNHGDHFAPRYFFGLYIPTFFLIGIFFSKIEFFKSITRKGLYVILIFFSIVSIIYWKKNIKWTFHMQKEVSKFTDTIRKNTEDIIIFYDYAYPLNSVNLYPERRYFVADNDEKLEKLLKSLQEKEEMNFQFIFNPLLPSKPNLEVFNNNGFQKKEKLSEPGITILHYSK